MATNHSRLPSYFLRGLCVAIMLFALVLGLASYNLNRVQKHEVGNDLFQSVDAELILTTSESSVINVVDQTHYRGFNRPLGKPSIYAPTITLHDPSLTPDVIRPMILHLRNVIPLEVQNIAGMNLQES